MQWNNDTGYQQTNYSQDVYADVKPSYSGNPFQQDVQEFSLSSIQERLGAISTVEDLEITEASPDLKPSEQTLNMSYQRNYSAEKSHTAAKLSTKSKVMIASYVVVVLALILAVTLCSVSVTNAFGSALILSGNYTDVSSELAELNKLVQAEDFDALNQRATELGYTEASGPNTMGYTGLETRPAQNFEVETNWFDSLCDWLSNVFGG